MIYIYIYICKGCTMILLFFPITYINNSPSSIGKYILYNLNLLHSKAK